MHRAQKCLSVAHQTGSWRYRMVVVGAFGCVVFAILMGALFGVVGFIIGLGVGGPAFLAWFYYRVDLKTKTRQKRHD